VHQDIYAYHLVSLKSNSVEKRCETVVNVVRDASNALLQFEKNHEVQSLLLKRCVSTID
jgi:hypothetical protein